MPAAEAGPDASTPGTVPGDADHAALFAPFVDHCRVLLAVSGGPDSTALMLLAARWRGLGIAFTELHVATVDHGLRPEARDEAQAVAALAGQLGLPHAILDLAVPLPRSRLQEAARHARYERLAAHAREIGASAIVTAHTADDQAETVLFRLMRGSGLSGLAGIPVVREMDGVVLIRPLLGLRKAALVETCRQAGVDFARDPSNHDPRFARARLRDLLPLLAAEGLDAPRLARLAERVARAEAALEAAADAAASRLVSGTDTLRLDRAGLLALPAEIGLRLLVRALEDKATGPVELAKLEVLHGWLTGLPLQASGARTLAGALVRVDTRSVKIACAPARRAKRAPV